MAFTEESDTVDPKAGYTCTFVEEPPELFKCGVCRLVLRDPQITECCRKNACRPCIERAIKGDGVCPFPGCKANKIRGFSDRTLKYEILERKVYCSSLKKDSTEHCGCQWVGKLEDLNKHLEDCPFHEIGCRYHCGITAQRRSIQDHEVSCERFPLHCRQCGSEYERQHQDRHLKVCPFTTNDCPFKVVGCTRQVLNRDLQEHFKEALSDHFSLVAKQSCDVEAQVRKTGLMFREQNDKLMTRKNEVTDLNNEEKIAQERIIELQKAIKEATMECEELKRKHAMIKEKVDNEISQRDVSLDQFKSRLTRLTTESKVRCYGLALPRPHPSNIVSRPLETPPTSVEYTPGVVFSILNFQKERENDALLYLPPFFSHAGGYKMCLLVYCNGHRKGKNRALSISIRIMKGQYDDHLQWPMGCKLVIELSNIRHIRSHKKTVDVKFWGPSAEDMQFNNVKELEALRPLIDGCLTITVSKATIRAL